MPVEYLCNELSIVHANALSRRCEVDQTITPLHILKRDTKIAFRYHTIDGRVCSAKSFQHLTLSLNLQVRRTQLNMTSIEHYNTILRLLEDLRCPMLDFRPRTKSSHTRCQDRATSSNAPANAGQYRLMQDGIHDTFIRPQSMTSSNTRNGSFSSYHVQPMINQDIAFSTPLHLHSASDVGKPTPQNAWPSYHPTSVKEVRPMSSHHPTTLSQLPGSLSDVIPKPRQLPFQDRRLSSSRSHGDSRNGSSSARPSSALVLSPLPKPTLITESSTHNTNSTKDTSKLALHGVGIDLRKAQQDVVGTKSVLALTTSSSSVLVPELTNRRFSKSTALSLPITLGNSVATHGTQTELLIDLTAGLDDFIKLGPDMRSLHVQNGITQLIKDDRFLALCEAVEQDFRGVLAGLSQSLT